MNREQEPRKLSWASLYAANRQAHRSTTTGQFISKQFSRQCAQWRQQIRQAGEVAEATATSVVGTAGPALASEPKESGR
jgi:hypothetical protein